MKKTCIMVGAFYVQAGYGTHARQIAKILNSFENLETMLRATIWGNTPFILRDMPEKVFLDEMNARCAKYSDDFVFDHSVQIILPDEFKPSLAHHNVGITAGVETTICNSKWVDGCNAMSHVIVPSTHIKEVLQRSGKLTVPIDIVPETFHTYLENTDLECDLNIDFEQEFNFLHVGQLTSRDETHDRKNIGGLIKLFCAAFEGNKNVGLVIKTNMAKNTIIDKHETLDTLKEIIAKHRKGQYPKITLIHGPMDDIDICKLYKHPKIKAFVSLTRGEGFGLPLLEAAAAGLPILATNWSAYLDFLNVIPKSFIKLDYKLVDIPKQKIDNRIFVSGAQWAQVIDEDVIRKLRKVYESYSLPKQWANDLQKVVLNNYNFESVKTLFTKTFNERINK